MCGAGGERQGNGGVLWGEEGRIRNAPVTSSGTSTDARLSPCLRHNTLLSRLPLPLPCPSHRPAHLTHPPACLLIYRPTRPPTQADEIFTTGTAVVVASVGSLTYRGTKKQYTVPGQPGPVALEMYKTLTDIQCEAAEDTQGWVVPVC